MRGVRHQFKRKRLGFSYVEVVFAIFLLATGAGITIAAFPIANVTRGRADMQNKAVGLAQKEIEAIRGLGYANATPTQLYANGLIDSTSATNGNTYTFTNVDSGVFDNPAKLLPSCTAAVTVAQADLDLRSVTVTITWTERGKIRTFTDGTLIANL